MTLKDTALRVLTHPIMMPLLKPLRSRIGTIFTLHRFGVNGSDLRRHPVDRLRTQLALLRRQRCNLVPLSELVTTLRNGDHPSPDSIAFTVDDGYADFRDIAAQVFREFDCPVTVFVTTDPVGRGTWFWWDRVEYAFDHVAPSIFRLEIGSTPVSFDCSTVLGRRAAAESVTERLKRLPDQERLSTLDRLCDAAGVSTAGPPPERFAPMAWSDLRGLVVDGLIDVAPHTVTHPILSCITTAGAAAEIGDSWRRLRQECPSAVPVLAYPNGAELDYSPEVVMATRQAGLVGAVTTRQDYLRQIPPDEADAIFHLPRFSCPVGLAQFSQIVNGLERIKIAVRSTTRSQRLRPT